MKIPTSEDEILDAALRAYETHREHQNPSATPASKAHSSIDEHFATLRNEANEIVASYRIEKSPGRLRLRRIE